MVFSTATATAGVSALTARALELEMATEPEQIYRAYNELWQKCLKAVGIRIRFKTQQWPENLKGADAGKLMMWMLGSAAVVT